MRSQQTLLQGHGVVTGEGDWGRGGDPLPSATSCPRGNNASRICEVKQPLDVPVTQITGQPPDCGHSANARWLMTSTISSIRRTEKQNSHLQLACSQFADSNNRDTKDYRRNKDFQIGHGSFHTISYTIRNYQRGRVNVVGTATAQGEPRRGKKFSLLHTRPDWSGGPQMQLVPGLFPGG
jgi:hypothetical protein